MTADPRTYSILSLFSHGILLGILLGGFILMLFVFAYARTRLHLTVLVVDAAGIVYAFMEGMVLLAFFLNQPALGRQFHRLQALAIPVFIVLIPAFIEATIALTPFWKKANRAVLFLMIAFVAFLFAVAFAAPDLFISVDRPFPAASAVSMRWPEVRGDAGPLYPARNAAVVAMLAYMLGFFLYQFLTRRNTRHILLPVIGLCCAFLTAFLDILLLYAAPPPLRFLLSVSSLTCVGITVFIVLALVSVMRRYEDETREIENARKIESLGALAGGIAHDFNNLLTAVTGYVSLVSEKAPAGSEERAFLEEALSASVRAQELAGELLSLSRGGEPKKELISLRDLVEDAKAFVPPEAGVAVVFSVDPRLRNIHADKAQIAQLLQNLIVNGFQAMSGGGRLQITAADAGGAPDVGRLPPGPYVKLMVRDTGPGISRADQDRLFDPFFTTKGKGHGLGLTIARRIVTLHGGAITVESREGAGTAFTVYLPACDEPLPSRPPAERTARALAGRVLYLEDEGGVAGVGRKMFAALGLEADTCARGEEAVALYRKAKAEGRPYDFVLLDVLVAGGKGGIETARELRRLDPGLVAAATSGYSDGDIARNFKKYGFNAFLPKPFRLGDLKELAEKILAGRT